MIDTILKSSIMSKLDNVQYSNDMIISIKLIQEAGGNLECGKSARPDGIFAESIEFAHHRIHCTTVFVSVYVSHMGIYLQISLRLLLYLLLTLYGALYTFVYNQENMLLHVNQV